MHMLLLLELHIVWDSPNSCLNVTYMTGVQIWRLPDLVLVTTLRGHKRGVWAAQFSPVDQAVATASGAHQVTCTHTCETDRLLPVQSS